MKDSRYWVPTLALTVALGLTGCDEKNSSGSDRQSRMVFSAPPRHAAVRTTHSGASESSALTSGALESFAEAKAMPAVSEEDHAHRWRASFDGDRRTLEGLHGGAETSAVSAQSGWGKPSPKSSLKYASAHRCLFPEHEPPSPSAASAQNSVDGQASLISLARGGSALAAFRTFQKKAYDAVVPLLDRASWGARKASRKEVAHDPYRVTVHHTQTASTMDEGTTLRTVRGIQRYHMFERSKEGKDDFTDIGYHFLIDGQGRVVEGRRADVRGAHAGGANTGNIGVAVLGDFDVQKPNEAQLASLRRTVSFLSILYGHKPSEKGFLEGHQHYGKTSCPGKYLAAMLDQLRVQIDAEALQAEQKLQAPTVTARRFVPLLVTKTAA